MGQRRKTGRVRPKVFMRSKSQRQRKRTGCGRYAIRRLQHPALHWINVAFFAGTDAFLGTHSSCVALISISSFGKQRFCSATSSSNDARSHWSNS